MWMSYYELFQLHHFQIKQLCNQQFQKDPCTHYVKNIHINSKTRQWIFMSDWKPNVIAPIWYQEIQSFEFETRREAKLAKQ
jgi:hypothetical protein